MASKKYILILASIFTLFSFAQVNAQSSGVYNLTSYDYTDSSLIPEKRMDQQSDFMNNRYLYPSKPRNQWEVGVSVGALNVSGDVRSSNVFNQALDPMKTLAFAINVRKAWGYVISTRLQYLHGSASGYNYEMADGHLTAPASRNPWTAAGYSTAFYNYHTKTRQLSMDVIAALNNVKYHKSSNKTSMYALAGIGGLLYEVNVDALNGTASYAADFATTVANNPTPSNGQIYTARKDIRTDLKNVFDGTYESDAERHGNRGWYNDYTFRPTVNAGLGVSFRLGKRVSLNIEDKVIFTMDDLVDGQRWQNQDHDGFTRDFDNINYLSVGVGVNLGNNATAPLWWVNPNDFMYNGLAQMTSPVGKCDADADGDGVSDCYDRCGDTPGGVAVDTHGCPLDTDGDGVADYKDKQLITPTECQPSDADGIGKCPCPDGCGQVKAAGCGTIGGGSVMFSGGSRSLSSSAQNSLKTLANSMRSNPNCSVVVMGNGSSSKVAQQRSWDRVNAVINYMVDRNGIDRGRFIFQYGLGGNANAVDYRAAGDGETGPSNTPPPFPNLKRN